MKTANKHKEHFKNTFRSYKNIRTKGERLGWVSFEDAESVDLRKVLTNGEVVKLSQDNSPMLVP